ncbi:hypothetical protein Tco_1062237 [Tanacetum coccineum]
MDGKVQSESLCLGFWHELFDLDAWRHERLTDEYHYWQDLGAVKGNNVGNNTWRDVWTEYHDMGFGGIKAVVEYKAYTA